VGGKDYPRTYQEFREWFGGEQACVEYLAGLRWPGGFDCPGCGCGDAWRTASRLWMCAECGLKTSVTAGTIFHRSHSPLSTWFAAVWFVCSQKNGVSALGLQQALGFGSYETAWAWLHKLRRAMVRPDRERLAGIVEVDQSFLGGQTPRRPGQVRGNYTDKVPIMIAVERDHRNRIGRIRLEVAQAPASLELVDFAREVVEPGSTIRTDGAAMFRRLAKFGYTHEPTTSYSAPDRDAVMPGVHLVSSLLKRWIAGTLHYRISHRHLPYYLDEFTFRFNRRRSRARGMLFYRLLQQAVDTDPHPLTDITGRPKR
jgi:hypothetical protein